MPPDIAANGLTTIKPGPAQTVHEPAFLLRRDQVMLIVTGRRTEMTQKALLFSIPAGVFWCGAAFFLIKWMVYWLKGNLAPGMNTSGASLFVLFLACALATGFGFYVTARAWLSRSSTRWQLSSLFFGILVFWAVSGH